MPSRPVHRARRTGMGLAARLLTGLLLTAGCTAGPTAQAPNSPPTTPFSSAPVPSPQDTPARTPTSHEATAAPQSTAATRTATALSSGSATRSSTPPPASNAGTASPPSTDGTCVAGRCYRVGPVHELPSGVAPESSGIAASSTTPGAYYLIDDGPGTDGIVAVRSDGSLIARIPIAGMSARNAEALAPGPCGQRAGRCLYVGDIGDNAAVRDGITVYRVTEPTLSPPPRAPLTADSWRYTYPDGPHNAEALVAGPDGALLVLTKSAPDPTSGQVPPHRIYRAPAGGGALVLVSTYRPPAPARPAQSLFTGTVVTDASYSAGRMLLLTYDEVVEYRAPTPDADPASFASWPHAELPAPPMIQSEGITADVAGCGYQVTSEQGPDRSRSSTAGITCR